MADDNQDIIDALKQPYMGPAKLYPGKGPSLQPDSPFAQWGKRQGEAAWGSILDTLKHPENMIGPGDLGAQTGMFIGPSAKGWNMGKQLLAASMERKGHSLEDIFDATGLFKGHRGEWRKEISDLPMKTHPIIPGNYTDVQDLVEHPELFNKYPETSDWQVKIDPKYGSSGTGSINISGDNTIKLGGNIDPKGLDERQQGVLLHELMHGIQNIEGWQSGANYKGTVDNLQRKLEKEYTKTGDPDILRQLQAYKLTRNKADIGHEAYSRVPGEVEARNVSDRYRLEKLGVPYYHPMVSNLRDVSDALKQRNINIYPTSKGYNMHLLKEDMPGGGTISPGRDVPPFALPPSLREMYDRLPHKYQDNMPVTMIGGRRYPWKTEDRPRHLQFDYTK